MNDKEIETMVEQFEDETADANPPTICIKCKHVDKREDAEADLPPTYWKCGSETRPDYVTGGNADLRVLPYCATKNDKGECPDYDAVIEIDPDGELPPEATQ